MNISLSKKRTSSIFSQRNQEQIDKNPVFTASITNATMKTT